MQRYKLVALSSAKKGRESDYNDWYDKNHLPDMLKIPGFLSAERFVSVFPGPYSYVAIYEIETDDLDAAIAEINRRAFTDQMVISDAIDPNAVQMTYCKPYCP